MLRSAVSALALTLLLTGSAVAADKVAPPDSHMAAALDLEAATNARIMVIQVAKAIAPMILQRERASHPDIDEKTAAAFELAITEEMEANIDSLLLMEANVYAKHFSEAELRDLAAFYRTGVGQKYITEMPAILNETMPLAQKWANEVAPLAVERARKKLAEKGMKA